jgi:hypothetical protein
MVTAWAILLASYSSKSNVSIFATKESIRGRSLSIEIQWWMRVADLTRHIEDQLTGILSGSLTGTNRNLYNEATKYDQSLLIAVIKHDSVASDIASQEDVLF